MALTRKLLRSMGIEDEKIDQIIDAHTETVNALKDERDGLKDAADRLKKAEADSRSSKPSRQTVSKRSSRRNTPISRHSRRYR